MKTYSIVLPAVLVFHVHGICLLTFNTEQPYNPKVQSGVIACKHNSSALWNLRSVPRHIRTEESNLCTTIHYALNLSDPIKIVLVAREHYIT